MTATITSAGASAAGPISDLIATAFTTLDVAAWLVPDRRERHRPMAGQFEMVTAHAADHGRVDVATDPATGVLVGAAVWFDCTFPLPPIPNYQRRLAALCGAHLSRFEALDAAMDTCHPTQGHHHLAFLAVAPDLQCQGIGTALLEVGHARIDRTGVPAYLEAADEHSRVLYERHGYRPQDALQIDADGPLMWPMIRPAQYRPARTPHSC